MGTPSPSVSPSVSPSIYEQDDPLSRDLGETGLSDDEDEHPGPDGTLDRPKIQRTGTTATMKSTISKKEKPAPLKKGQHYELSRESDVVGVIFLEINSITDLPPERNG